MRSNSEKFEERNPDCATSKHDGVPLGQTTVFSVLAMAYCVGGISSSRGRTLTNQVLYWLKPQRYPGASVTENVIQGPLSSPAIHPGQEGEFSVASVIIGWKDGEEFDKDP